MRRHLPMQSILKTPSCMLFYSFVLVYTADAMEVDSPKHGYEPKKALMCAIEDWIPEFYKSKGQLLLMLLYTSNYIL